MRPKILISSITMDHGNLVPLLAKIKYWESIDCECTVFSTDFVRHEIISSRCLNCKFEVLPVNSGGIGSKLNIMWQALKKNILALPYVARFKNKYEVVYSVTSVLDAIIFPFLLKCIDKNIFWATVFDNTVPFRDPGNPLIRFLTWVFFQISLVLLKRADTIFTISKDLKEYLIQRGFKETCIVVTGNAVEGGVIKQVTRSANYLFDALFVGRINETKGIYDMLKILELVKKEYPDFQLAIMGRGDEVTERELKKTIQMHGLESNIQILGYKSGVEKFTLMKSSKCFWFFSISESFGVALLEAVCCGLPAFAYDLPSYKIIYRNNEVTIIEKHNYVEAARQVLELFNKNDFDNKKGEKLIDVYRWDIIAMKEYKVFSTAFESALISPHSS